jgi:hypothetical protein
LRSRALVDVTLESPDRAAEVCSEPVDDLPAGNRVGEQSKTRVPVRVVLPRSDPELAEDVGREVLASMDGEDDVAPSQGSFNDSDDEGFDVETLDLERPI